MKIKVSMGSGKTPEIINLPNTRGEAVRFWFSQVSIMLWVEEDFEDTHWLDDDAKVRYRRELTIIREAKQEVFEMLVGMGEKE